MTNNQIAGLIITLFGLGLAFFKYYIDAKFEHTFDKINSIQKQVDFIVKYMIEHHERLAKLEEKTKNL